MWHTQRGPLCQWPPSPMVHLAILSLCWHDTHVAIIFCIYLSICGHQYNSCSLCLVRTLPWCPSCAKSTTLDCVGTTKRSVPLVTRKSCIGRFIMYLKEWSKSRCHILSAFWPSFLYLLLQRSQIRTGLTCISKLWQRHGTQRFPKDYSHHVWSLCSISCDR